MSIDRVAPQSVEAEQSVLGSILIDPEAILKVADFLHGADFYRAQHADIYEAMLALHSQREPIDLVTLGDELTRHDKLEGVGGPAYLATLMNAVPTAVHVEHYGRIVEQKAVLRNLIAAAGRIAAVGYEEANDTAAAIDRAESILFEISQRRTVAGFETLATLLGQAYDRLEYLHEHRGQILGIPTGLAGLDTLLGGFQPSDLVILAARPSVGKTSLALNVALHAAVHEQKRVAIFSLEMSREQLALRLLSSETGINPRPLQTGFMEETDWSKIAKVMNDMASARMWIDDSPTLSVLELRTKTRRLEVEQQGLDLVIVDYLQLMQASTPTRDPNRVQEVSEISRGLKNLARAEGARSSPCPSCRETWSSGAARSRACRTSASPARSSRTRTSSSSCTGRTGEPNPDADLELVKAKIAKHRNGPIGEVPLQFRRTQTRFYSVAAREEVEVTPY